MNRKLFVIALALGGCSRPSPTPTPTPVGPPTTPLRVDLPPCPDSTDTPQIVEANVSRALAATQSSPNQVAPSCFAVAVAREPWSWPDSTIRGALILSDAIVQRNPGDVANLQARLSLLTRGGRPREVPATFNALVQRDGSRATLENYRLAIAASMRAKDTAQRIRLLAAAVRRYPNASSLVAENNIMRQLNRLHGLPDSVYRIMRLDPSRADLNATLASIYGNLDRPDSALYFTGLALRRGVNRGAVANSLASLVGVTLRKAQLLDAPDIWEATLPVAKSIDSTLSTDASRHVYALSLTQVVGVRADAYTRVLGGPLDPPRNLAADRRNATCANVRALPRMLDAASQLFASGGNRFAAETMPAITAGILKLRQQIDQLERRCAA